MYAKINSRAHDVTQEIERKLGTTQVYNKSSVFVTPLSSPVSLYLFIYFSVFLYLFFLSSGLPHLSSMMSLVTRRAETCKSRGVVF